VKALKHRKLFLVTLLFSITLFTLGATSAFAGGTDILAITEKEESSPTTGMAFFIEIDNMEAEGKYSNDKISSIFVDFTNIMTSGSVTMAVYEGEDQNSTTDTFSVIPLTWDEAEQQLVKYVLGNIANLYRVEYDTDIVS
jgi:hypothetical protein